MSFLLSLVECVNIRVDSQCGISSEEKPRRAKFPAITFRRQPNETDFISLLQSFRESIPNLLRCVEEPSASNSVTPPQTSANVSTTAVKNDFE